MRSHQWSVRAGEASVGTKARTQSLPAGGALVSPAGLPVGSFLLAVQRQYGNRFAQRLLESASGQRPPGPVPRVQPMLRLGSPGDRFERQADLVARRVTSHRPGQGPADHVAERDDQSRNQAEKSKPRVSVGLEMPIRHRAGAGRPLARTVAGPLEKAFGANFGDVRVHTDAGSDDMCRSIGARALTVGDHIFFRRGEQPSDSTSSRHLLAHELTHVVQQRGAVPPGGSGYAEPAGITSAPRGTIQPFWVLRYGKFYWRPTLDSYKFFKLPDVTHESPNHPGQQPVFVEPWEKPGTKLQIEPETHRVLPKMRQKVLGSLQKRVVRLLRKIRSTGIGSRLLRDLAAKTPKKTAIVPEEAGPDPQTVYPSTNESRVELQLKKVYDAWDWLVSAQGRVEVQWRMMPPDVVLFHELVHAYHYAHDSTAAGRVLEADARNPVDVGVMRNEYQAVGLDARHGAFRYSDELFTENKYRRVVGLPPRTTYMVPYTDVVPLARRSSLAALDAEERASESE